MISLPRNNTNKSEGGSKLRWGQMYVKGGVKSCLGGRDGDKIINKILDLYFSYRSLLNFS